MRLGACLVALVSSISGVAFSEDRWQWLEPPHDPVALNWASDRTEQARLALSSVPEYTEALARLQSLMATAELPPDISTLDEHRLIRFQRSADQPDGELAVAYWQDDGELGPWQSVFDVTTFNRNEAQHYELRWRGAGAHCLPPAMNRCLLHLSPGGVDEEMVKEFDLRSGEFVSDGFVVPASRTQAVWLAEHQLLIQHTVGEAAPRTIAGWPAAVRLWQRGQSLEDSQTIFEAEPNDALVFLALTGTLERQDAVIARAIDYSNFEFWHYQAKDGLRKIDLPATVKLMFPTPVSARHVFVQLSASATVNGREFPAETILAYNLYDQDVDRVSVVYEPRPGEYLINALTGGLAASDQHLWLVLDRRGIQQVVAAQWTDGQWSLEWWPTEAPGVTVTFSDAHPLSSALVVERSGLLHPTGLTWFRPSDGRTSLLYSESSLFDETAFEVTIDTAISRDGTEIDYFMLRPAMSRPREPLPVLMTGYGAFGVSYSPKYFDFFVGGRSLVPWLERGGALVVPLIRGGGERGAAWHTAAMREHRQRSYDDFIAVAEALVGQDGVTTPERLGVFGISNGGLLAAVMGTQRPDLFSAVVSDVPLTDMLRFPEMGMGSAWINEYGNPIDPEMAAVLRAYSPLHNVHSDREYPPFLLTVATSDNRVGPGHARKLAAQLAASGTEVFFIEDEEGGHGVSDPLSRPELMAQRLAFFLTRLMPVTAP